MNGPLEWIAAIGVVIAASLIALDLGRKATGWGFVLFCVVSGAWIVSGLSAKDGTPIVVQNSLLLLINAYGVWQFLLSPKKRAEIDRGEKAKDEAD